MKGFYISIKNDLLEPKHYQNMGEAIWLYLWLIDKMTSVNENGLGKVLGNQPITHDLITESLGIHRNTYGKYVKILRNAGYIQTLRTPHGLIITVNKASKSFKKRSTRTSASKRQSDAQTRVQQNDKVMHTKRASDAHDWGSDAQTRVLVNKDNNKTITRQDNTTNVVGANAPVVYGKNEINDMFVYWQEQTGLGIQAKRQANRNACNNLIKQHGLDGVRRLVNGVVLSQTDKFAPRIADFCDLQSKLNQLLLWGKKRALKQGGTIKI